MKHRTRTSVPRWLLLASMFINMAVAGYALMLLGLWVFHIPAGHR